MGVPPTSAAVKNTAFSKEIRANYGFPERS